MDEKLGIRFQKMQPLIQNYSYFAFLFKKRSKMFMLCMLVDKI